MPPAPLPWHEEKILTTFLFYHKREMPFELARKRRLHFVIPPMSHVPSMWDRRTENGSVWEMEFGNKRITIQMATVGVPSQVRHEKGPWIVVCHDGAPGKVRLQNTLLRQALLQPDGFRRLKPLH